MHFCCLVVTREVPTYDMLVQIMEPFDEVKYFRKDAKDRDPEVPFLCDYFAIAGRYYGVLRMKEEKEEDVGKAYRTSASLGDPLDLDYIVGRRCYCLVDVDGKGYAREWYHYRKQKWITEHDFAVRMKELLENRKDCYLTVVDIHE